MSAKEHGYRGLGDFEVLRYCTAGHANRADHRAIGTVDRQTARKEGQAAVAGFQVVRWRSRLAIFPHGFAADGEQRRSGGFAHGEINRSEDRGVHADERIECAPASSTAMLAATPIRSAQAPAEAIA